jgi:hypothetical protein
MSKDWFNSGGSSGVLGGGPVINMNDDVRFKDVGGMNSATSLSIKRGGSMQDWTRACCMQDIGNTQFKTINKNSCGIYWGGSGVCDNLMGKYCAKPENAGAQSCRCINKNQDPALAPNTDPALVRLINDRPQCTKICSGVDTTIYKPSKLSPCDGNFSLQITNCTQNTQIQGADNIVSGSNISLDCKPTQVNQNITNTQPYVPPSYSKPPSEDIVVYNNLGTKKNETIKSSNILLYLLIFIVIVVLIFIFTNDEIDLTKNTAVDLSES